ncbi:MAG TPA: M56 family metallopeptidase [Flavisolibacter sp.]|nr:M56 family metallopeptidase [Flavisolibacter sp.]
MANWSQSHFLQSLGWATLNSFWQMALLWCLFLGACHLFKPGAHKKYQLSVIAIISGFVWFIICFIQFYTSNPVSTIAFFDQSIPETDSILNILLISASVAYLSLLAFPTWRLYKNYLFVQKIKKEGLNKADLTYRLFVQKISGHLNISKKVMVYVSSIVRSPLTIGYLKPIILLPVASLNNLSIQQVEAVLLHELSHIKRYDYLVNLVISIIHTVLYFNPFVKQFMKTIEAERETCCDELVLQFGYDKVSYASALLTLERVASSSSHILAIGATGKNSLLNRIEKIVGMEKKKRFQFSQLAGVLAALFCIIALNSVLIIKEKKRQGNYAFAYNTMANPFALFSAADENASASESITPTPIVVSRATVFIASAKDDKRVSPKESTMVQPEENQEVGMQAPGYIQVAQDAVDASLTAEQKQQVAKTVDATKRVMKTLQWKEVESQIADAMTMKEKAMAQQQYNKELEKINWQNIEQNLKAQYEKIDWTRINTNLSNAQTEIELDSLQINCEQALTQLEKAETEMSQAQLTTCSPIPDVSLSAIRNAKTSLNVKLEKIKALRSDKKVIRL